MTFFLNRMRVKLAFSEYCCQYMGCSYETKRVNIILAVI